MSDNRVRGSGGCSRSADVTVAADPSMVRFVRAFVRQWCIGQGALGDGVDRVVLLTSELVGNAVQHGQGPIHIQVAVHGHGIRVSVADQHHELPTPKQCPAEAEHGRGLLLVSELATSWGVEPRDAGKAVWFEVHDAALAVQG